LATMARLAFLVSVGPQLLQDFAVVGVKDMKPDGLGRPLELARLTDRASGVPRSNFDFVKRFEVSEVAKRYR